MPRAKLLPPWGWRTGLIGEVRGGEGDEEDREEIRSGVLALARI